MAASQAAGQPVGALRGIPSHAGDVVVILARHVSATSEGPETLGWVVRTPALLKVNVVRPGVAGVEGADTNSPASQSEVACATQFHLSKLSIAPSDSIGHRRPDPGETWRYAPALCGSTSRLAVGVLEADGRPTAACVGCRTTLP